MPSIGPSSNLEYIIKFKDMIKLSLKKFNTVACLELDLGQT